MQQALEHEQAVTRAIHELYDIALSEHDYATQIQLQWFITEQIEEENTVGTIVERLKLVSGEPTGILFMDREMGERSARATADHSAA
jgi:ferritin